MKHPIIAGLFAAVLVIGAAVPFLAPPARAAECRGSMVRASWYGAESGNRTANGERFDGGSMTAAHRTLPFGTRLKVSYRGKSVTVRINDRGPFVAGRSLDLAKRAAAQLGLTAAGVGTVCVEKLG
jgi:rare lipoprotein A